MSLAAEIFQDVVLLGFVLVITVGARWVGWKLGWLANPWVVMRTAAEHARALLNDKLGLVKGPVPGLEQPLTGDGVVVDPARPMEPLDRAMDLAHDARGTGLWGELRQSYGMTLGRLESGHPFLQGSVHGQGVSITQSAAGLSLVASVPKGLRAVLGAGDTGNPVLDMLLDTQGIPPGADEAVLALVHGHGAQLQDGELSLLYPGPLGDVWPMVELLLRSSSSSA